MAADDLDPIALLSPLHTGLRLMRIVQRWNEGPERASIYRDHYEEWVADLAQALREHAQDVEALAERLDAVEQDRERVLVLGNIGFEAWREAVDRRRAMLGDAAVAAVFSELSAAELARVERTIRMLDPEDLDLLASLIEGPLELFVDPHWRHQRLQDGHLQGAALCASGCVLITSPAGMEVDQGGSFGAWVTPIGQMVLRFMGRSRSGTEAAVGTRDDR